MSYPMHSTPGEAIQAFEEATGKPWAEHLAQGATLVQREIIEFPKPGSGE